MDHGNDVTFSEKFRRKLKINVFVKNIHLFKTLQWNHSPTARGSTWVLNILWSHFYGLLECRPADLLNEARSRARYLCYKHACSTDFNSSISHISAPVISDCCSMTSFSYRYLNSSYCFSSLCKLHPFSTFLREYLNLKMQKEVTFINFKVYSGRCMFWITSP